MVNITKFGTTKEGLPAELYEIVNSDGARAVVSDYGATLVSLYIRDKDGNFKDVVLGYDALSDYENSDSYFGGTIGRCANRLRYGEFILNGEEYTLDINDNGINSLHGGYEGFNKKCWATSVEENAVTFSLISPEFDGGYPGNLIVTIRYEFTDDNELKISYLAQSDADTIVNLTNHSYFNLDGHDSETCLDAELCVNAPFYLPVNEYSQLTGEIRKCEGTPFDFSSPKVIGKDIEVDDIQLRLTNGYDHTLVFEKSERGAFEKCAELKSLNSGICMEVYTTEPSAQFYTGNYINNEKGKGGVLYSKHQGICFETQLFPDAMHNTFFPSPILKKGEKYTSLTTYKFYAVR